MNEFGAVDFDSLTGMILGGLSATRGDVRSGEAPSVVTLTYRTGNPMAAKAVLEEVIEAHTRVVAKSYGDLDKQTGRVHRTRERVKLSQNSSMRLSSSIVEAKLDSVTKVDRSLVAGGDKPSLNEKSAFQQKEEALLTRNEEIKAHLNAIHKGWLNYKSTKTLLAMAERFGSTSGPVNAPTPISDLMLSLMAQEQDLASLFGKDYLPLQRLQAKIALLKKYSGRNMEPAR